MCASKNEFSLGIPISTNPSTFARGQRRKRGTFENFVRIFQFSCSTFHLHAERSKTPCNQPSLPTLSSRGFLPLTQFVWLTPPLSLRSAPAKPDVASAANLFRREVSGIKLGNTEGCRATSALRRKAKLQRWKT